MDTHTHPFLSCNSTGTDFYRMERLRTLQLRQNASPRHANSPSPRQPQPRPPITSFATDASKISASSPPAWRSTCLPTPRIPTTSAWKRSITASAETSRRGTRRCAPTAKTKSGEPSSKLPTRPGPTTSGAWLSAHGISGKGAAQQRLLWTGLIWRARRCGGGVCWCRCSGTSSLSCISFKYQIQMGECAIRTREIQLAMPRPSSNRWRISFPG